MLVNHSDTTTLNLTHEKKELPQCKHILFVVQGLRQLPVHILRSWRRLIVFWCEPLGIHGQWQKKNVNHAVNNPRTEHSSFWLTRNKQMHVRLATHRFQRLSNGSQCSRKTKWFCEVTQIMSIPPSWLIPAQRHSQHFIQIYSKNTQLEITTVSVLLPIFVGVDTKREQKGEAHVFVKKRKTL